MSAAPPPPPVSSEAINLVLDFLASKNFTAAETALRAQLARDATASSQEAEELADVAVSVSSLEKLLESNPSRTAEGNGNPTGPADSVDPAPLPVSPVRAQPPVVFYDPAAFTAADEWSDDEDIGYRRIPCTEEALLTGNVPSPHRPPPSLPQGAPSARDPAFELFPNLQSRPLDERDLGGAARHDAPVHGGFDRPPREEEAPASAADSGAAATEAPPAENGDLEAEGGEADDEAEDEAADDETSASAAPPPASADVAAVPAEPADAPVSASAGASEGAPSAPAAVADAEGGAESSGEAATAQAPDDNKPEEAAQVAEAAAAEAPAAEAVAVEAPAAEAAAPAAEAPPATAAPTEEPAAPPVAETTVSLGRDSIHADFEAAPPDEDEGEGEEEDDDSVEADRLPTRPTRPTLPRTMGRRPPQEGDDDPYGDGLDPNMDADFADGGEEDAGEEEAEEAEEDEDEDEDEEEGEEVILESDPDIDPYERSAAEEAKYETLHLKVVHERAKTGFEEHKDFPIRINSLIAARYQVKEYLGSAAFSKAVQCVDLHSGELVCIKIIKNNKDFFDQSLDEIKLLQYIKHHDTADSHNVLHIFDFFYHKEHLFIVCELLRDNLYEFSRYNREAGCEPYFTLPRLRRIAKQCLDALRFVHNLDLIHCDLKPENILIRSYSRCEIKVIDFGSSCFTNDHLSSYVQSRSYRAPEVILGLPYDQKIDLWSLGAILAELLTGYVLFQNDSVPSMLSRIVGILGPFPDGMLQRGRHAHKYFLPNGAVYERDAANRPCLLEPKMSPLRHRLHTDDELFISFVGSLLRIDPDDRPTAEQALQHPFITSDAYGEVLA